MTTTRTEQPPRLRMLSSMATRHVLEELAGRYSALSGVRVELDSMGGVDAAQKIRDGAAYDLVVLASSAIDSLVKQGCLRPESVAAITESQVAVAVQAGCTVPDISTESALRQAVESAATLGYSTGPSGTGLLALFKRWGILDALQARLVQAPAGIPVAQLVAQGRVALGFQQLSEVQGADGISLVGVLPPACAIVSTFTGAVASSSPWPEAAAQLLSSLTSADMDTVKLRHGMTPPSRHAPDNT